MSNTDIGAGISAGFNAVVTSKGRWMAPPQVPITGSYWTWWDGKLVLAGGQRQWWQRNIGTAQPGMMETISAKALSVFVITHMNEVEATGKAQVVRETIRFTKMVWNSCPGIMMAIGPSDPAYVIGTRDAVAGQLYDQISDDVRRFKPYVAYEGVSDPFAEIDRKPHDQWPCTFQAEDVSGYLSEPRDDPDNPPSWTMSKNAPFHNRMRASLDSIIDDPRQRLTDLPQMAATAGALIAIMHNERWAPFPLRRKGGDAEDDWFDLLYDEISTHR